MRGTLSAMLVVFLLFVFSGTNNAEDKSGAQSVLKELDDFQKSLSNWMKNLDTMESQVTVLQKNVGESLAPLKEFDKVVKGIEEKLNDNIAKMQALEKASSIAEIKGMLDSFGKTFDVLKKLLSDITKRVEDQEIKTSVLEKKYQEAQRPLEPIKKAIEDLSKLMTDKLGEQEKRIAATEEGVKTRVASLDTTIKSLDGQMKTISDLEMRMKKLEKTGIPLTGTVTTEAPLIPLQAPVGTETIKLEKGTETVEVAKEHISTPEEEGFKEIGDGFYIRNENLLLFGSSSQVRGEIKNLSDRDRSIATFVIKVYNASDMLLFSQDFSIKTFKKGEVRLFSEIISGYTPLDIARYEIVTKRRY